MDAHHWILKFKDQEFDAEYIKDKTEALTILSKLQSKDCLFGIDTETAAAPLYSHIGKAGLSPHLSRIRLLQVATDTSVVVFDLGAIGSDEIFIHFLESKKFVAHYAIFDLQFFLRMGVKKMDLGCTFIAGKLLIHATYDESNEIPCGLADLSKELLKYEHSKKMQASNWAEPDLTFEQIEYSAIDAICTRELALLMARGINKHGMGKVYNLYKKALWPLAEMQLNGVKLDKTSHSKLIDTWRYDMVRAKKEVEELTGLTSLTPKNIAEYLESKLSPEELAIWPRTPTGKISVDANALSEFSYLDIVKPFEKYQKSLKLLTTYGIKMANHINPSSGRIHTKFNICGARTGRLSSSEPNLQNAPRDKAFRNLFIPSNGKVFVCSDLSQIELRVAAEVSGDKQMKHAYKNSLDIHLLTACQLSNKSASDVSKESRQAAKAVSLGLLFGLGPSKLGSYAKKSYGIEFNAETSIKAVETWRDFYSDYYSWQKKQGKACEETLKAVTPLGKIRRLHPKAYYGAGLNHPIQGGAAEIILSALVNLYDCYKENKSVKIINTVHDEILVECDSRDAPQVLREVERCMVEGYESIFPGGLTKGLVESKIGNSWGDAK